MRLYKVLKAEGDKLISPFQAFEYQTNETLTCSDFDDNPKRDCSYGFYATKFDGLIYSFRNLPDYRVWEVEVGGRQVEIDQFKRRYEIIRLIREVPVDEVKAFSSLFPNIDWKYVQHEPGENPFQSCIDLWHAGLVPSYDGKKWRLHVGEKAQIVWEGVI